MGEKVQPFFKKWSEEHVVSMLHIHFMTKLILNTFSESFDSGFDKTEIIMEIMIMIIR